MKKLIVDFYCTKCGYRDTIVFTNRDLDTINKQKCTRCNSRKYMSYERITRLTELPNGETVAKVLAQG